MAKMNSVNSIVFAVAFGITVLAARDLPGQATRPVAPPRPRPESAIIAEINQQLTSDDPAIRQLAIDAIRARLSSRGLSDLRSYFLRPLVNAKLNADIVNLSMEGILQFPGETRSVEQTLIARIKALLALGKVEEALANAKSLFNIATMSGTSEAILVVAECLNAAKPDDPELFNRFRDEQIAGAAASGSTTQPAVKSTVLAGIKVDPKPYEDALRRFTAEDASGLMARGNLLLLADRVKDARPIFQRLYSLAGSDVNEASEALARLIKAEDGTIGRANAWVLSIRPQKAPR